jgi:hypothetical protein
MLTNLHHMRRLSSSITGSHDQLNHSGGRVNKFNIIQKSYNQAVKKLSNLKIDTTQIKHHSYNTAARKSSTTSNKKTRKPTMQSFELNKSNRRSPAASVKKAMTRIVSPADSPALSTM